VDIVLSVQPGDDFSQEGLKFGIRVRAIAVIEPKLGDPDGTSAGHGVGGLNVGFKVVGTGPLVRVPVNVDEIDVAIGAGVEKLLKPRQTAGGTRVGHGRGPE
jgi:hypothetical protein